MSNVYSDLKQLQQIEKTLTGYLKLPFSGDSVPGALLEEVVANIRNGKVLNTYDFVDVLNIKNKVGWQVKSTKASTPVTWKRAKIPNSKKLIENSYNTAKDMQLLGDSIINFCNGHAIESMQTYGLDVLGYARLIVHKDNKITYFERVLCTKEEPNIFNKNDFIWNWSTPKKTIKKEQLPALHAINIHTKEKWFAWHGLGENQLHFSGEKVW